MDRPGSPASPPNTSSAASNLPGTLTATQAPEPPNVGDSGSLPAPGPSSEGSDPTPHPPVLEGQEAIALQQSPVEVSVPPPTLHDETAKESSPLATPEVPVVQQPHEPAPIERAPEPAVELGASSTPAAQRTPELMASDTGARQTTGTTLRDDQSAPSNTPPTDQRALEPASGTGTRPTTSFILGAPGTSEPHHGSNPPTPPPRPFLPPIRMGRSTSVGVIGPSAERLEDSETLSGLGHHDLGRDSGMPLNQTLPILPSQARLADPGGPRRQRTVDGHGSNIGHGMGRRSGIDWAVPVIGAEDLKRKRTVSERLAPTIENAQEECNKFRTRARMAGLALNAAIGLQVLLGSITTGLSAVATSGARSTAIETTIFGALSTLVASFLARARGYNEPELSIARVKDLEQFLREARAFELDHGHVDTDEWDHEIDHFRKRFEELLGNVNNERKLTPKSGSPPA